MSNCEQSKGFSVLDHGKHVWLYTQRILNKDIDGMKIPIWLSDNYDEILKNVHNNYVIKNYNFYHDCGKPFCLEVDSDGKRHFPNHANVSKQTFIDVFGDFHVEISNLIGWDMVLHTETADEIKDRNFNKKDAYTLLITALAELHSNAKLFGGTDSISFKQKFKKLNRRGNMFLKGGIDG